MMQQAKTFGEVLKSVRERRYISRHIERAGDKPKIIDIEEYNNLSPKERKTFRKLTADEMSLQLGARGIIHTFENDRRVPESGTFTEIIELLKPDTQEMQDLQTAYTQASREKAPALWEELQVPAPKAVMGNKPSRLHNQEKMSPRDTAAFNKYCAYLQQENITQSALAGKLGYGPETTDKNGRHVSRFTKGKTSKALFLKLVTEGLGFADMDSFYRAVEALPAESLQPALNRRNGDDHHAR